VCFSFLILIGRFVTLEAVIVSWLSMIVSGSTPMHYPMSMGSSAAAAGGGLAGGSRGDPE
jgi:hypothetical protein